MITKMAEQMIKEASLEGAIAGALRASNLGKEDRKLLRDEYGLPDDASLGWRNAGRGFLGGLVGAGAGNIVSSPIGVSLMHKSPIAGAATILGGTLGGYGLGAYLATNKYSKGRAEEIRKRRGLTKESSIGVITGAMRAGELTPDDKRVLVDEYGLSDDSNLVFRNAGRGYLGAMGGAAIGAGIGAGLRRVLKGKNPLAYLGGGAAIGTGIGAGMATNKYSRRRAEEIRQRRGLAS